MKREHHVFITPRRDENAMITFHHVSITLCERVYVTCDFVWCANVFLNADLYISVVRMICLRANLFFLFMRTCTCLLCEPGVPRPTGFPESTNGFCCASVCYVRAVFLYWLRMLFCTWKSVCLCMRIVFCSSFELRPPNRTNNICCKRTCVLQYAHARSVHDISTTLTHVVCSRTLGYHYRTHVYAYICSQMPTHVHDDRVHGRLHMFTHAGTRSRLLLRKFSF